MVKSLYPKLAAQNMRKNRRFFLPYLLAIAGLAAAFYVMAALVFDPGAESLRGWPFVKAMMAIGMVVAGLLSAVLLLYINSFLMKQRKRELGLYNILGMGKGNIALVQCWESLYTAVLSIGGGLLCGLGFHWVATTALIRLLQFQIPFHSAVSIPALLLTAALFGGLLVLALLLNLGQVRLSNPIQLLRGGDVGEREPKTRWLMTIIGVLALGAGYAIAIMTDDPTVALALYFLAVLLVIVGTYCLFTAGSIAVLKLLRRNKKFYYKTSHFIGISGMLYRMKRNAVGLANICILSTMVMVMISGTLSLYLGTGDIIDVQYPSDFQLEVRYEETEETADDPFNGQATMDLATRFIQEQGVTVTGSRAIHYLFLDMSLMEGREDAMRLASSNVRSANRKVYFITAEDYAAFTGRQAPALAPGQLALCGEGATGQMTFETVDQVALTFTVTETLPTVDYFSATFDTVEVVCYVVPDRETLSQLYRMNRGSRDYRYLAMLDLDCDSQTCLELENAWWNASSQEDFYEGTGSWSRMELSLRVEAEIDGYAMAGGFLFLGILLGVIFLMATALIIYYKQVSEGYEDQGRFEIMRKVGLSQREVKASIRSQVLLVFLLPILVAAIHILFDFNLVAQLLTLLAVRNVATVALCTGGTLLAFCAVYGLMYLLTARTYYKIVR